MIRIASLLTLFALTAGCTHFSGYHSKAVPEVMVVAEESGRRPYGLASTITLVHPRPESLMVVVDALLTRVRARGGHYVMGLEAQWIETREAGFFRCGARIQPVVVSGPEGSAPDSASAEMRQAYGLDPGFGQQGIPSDQPLSRTKGRYLMPRAGLVGHRQWGLGMMTPVCVGTTGPGTDKVTLDATVY